MNFSQALENLKLGKKLRRKGNAEVLRLVTPDSDLRVQTGKGTRGTFGTFIGVVWEGGQVSPWHVPHADLLADDWEIVK
jgi:hypothetical protein